MIINNGVNSLNGKPLYILKKVHIKLMNDVLHIQSSIHTVDY